MRIIRIRFSKTANAAYISHLDLQRVMQRAMAKAQLPAWYSQGYNPRIYLTFPLPLPLGQESVCEAMDFKTEDDALQMQTVVDALNGALPPDIRVFSAAEPVHAVRRIAFATYRMRLPSLPAVEDAVRACNESEQVLVTKIGKQDGRKTVKQTDLKPYLPTLVWEKEGEWLTMEPLLPAGSTVNVNPAALVQYCQQLSGVDLASVSIMRTQILTDTKEIFR